MTASYNFVINQGSTFRKTLNYSSPDFNIVTISAITKSIRPTVTATAHGILTPKVKVFIGGVVGMDQINNADNLDRTDKAYTATVVNTNSLKLDMDTTKFNSYTSGGELAYRAPIDLTGWTARMQIRSEIDSTTVLISLTTENGGIALGDDAGTIELYISAEDTADIDWDCAVYDLELVNIDDEPDRILAGRITISDEVTR
jgi:hypothetical protein